MSPNEKELRFTANRIGLSMLIFFGMFQMLFEASSVISSALSHYLTHTVAYTISQIVHILVYLTCFMVPALILRAMLKSKGRFDGMMLELRLPKKYLCLVPAAVAVCFACSTVNYYILNLLGMGGIYNAMSGSVVYYEPYQIVLEFIAVALVPAVCEEFFFRGVITSGLCRFGNAVAVIGGAVMFALMHQNPAQLFYTFMVGIFLGYVYVKTESIACCTLIHFINNGISVFQSVILANCSESLGTVCAFIIDLVVYSLGAVGIIVFFALDKKEKLGRYADGSFGKLIEREDNAAQKQVPAHKALRCFMAPSVIVFFCLTAGYMLLILLQFS